MKLFSGLDNSQNGQDLDKKQLKKLLHSDPVSAIKIRNARGAETLADGLAFIGGVFAVFELGTSFSGRPIDNDVLIAGIVLIGVSVPINISAGHMQRDAVLAYNADTHVALQKRLPAACDLIFAGNRIGVNLKF